MNIIDVNIILFQKMRVLGDMGQFFWEGATCTMYVRMLLRFMYKFKQLITSLISFHLIFFFYLSGQGGQGLDSLDWLNQVIDSLQKVKKKSPPFFMFSNLLGKILTV